MKYRLGKEKKMNNQSQWPKKQKKNNNNNNKREREKINRKKQNDVDGESVSAEGVETKMRNTLSALVSKKKKKRRAG